MAGAWFNNEEIDPDDPKITGVVAKRFNQPPPSGGKGAHARKASIQYHVAGQCCLSSLLSSSMC